MPDAEFETVVLNTEDTCAGSSRVCTIADALVKVCLKLLFGSRSRGEGFRNDGCFDWNVVRARPPSEVAERREATCADARRIVTLGKAESLPV